MGGSKAPMGPAARRDLPGPAAVPARPGACVPRGRSRLRLCPEYQRSLRGPPGRARCGRGRAAAPPRLPPPPPPRTLLPGPARAGGAGGASSGFAARTPRLAPQPRVRAPAGTPPPALPAARPRPAAPPAYWRGQGAPRREDPIRLQLRALGRRGYGGGQARALAPARPAALAPRRLPERARRLRSEAPAAMIAGSGARAQARARLGGPRADRRSPACAQKRARRGQRLGSPARHCRGQRVPRSSRRGPGTGLGVDGGGGLPSGQGARQGDPAAASRTALVRRREGRGARCGGGRGARDLVKWRGAAH